MGHAEPAAGLMGLTAACLSLRQHSEPAVLHLRTLNPYVVAAVDEARSLQQGTFRMPRQQGPASALSSGAGGSAAPGGPATGPCCGVSAFAFQGTNAHIVMLQAGQAAGRSPGSSGLAWQRERLWVTPPISPFARLAAVVAGGSGGGGSTAVFETSLGHPALSCLASLRYYEQLLLPPALIIHVAATAVRLLQADTPSPWEGLGSKPGSIILCGGELSCFVFDEEGGHAGGGEEGAFGDASLRCSVEGDTGRLHMEYLAAAGAASAEHYTVLTAAAAHMLPPSVAGAMMAAVGASAAAAAAPPAGRAVAVLRRLVRQSMVSSGGGGGTKEEEEVEVGTATALYADVVDPLLGRGVQLEADVATCCMAEAALQLQGPVLLSSFDAWLVPGQAAASAGGPLSLP